MKPASFDYIRARTVAEAVNILDRSDGGARILAGGQSLVPMLNLRLSSATQLVDIKGIEELCEITEAPDLITIGSCVRHADFEDGLVPDPSKGLMQTVARHLAYRAIRNCGTIGGSVALADPSADWVTALLSLGTTFCAVSPSGRRNISTSEMMVAPYTTTLASNEVLTQILVPRLTNAARWGFYKVIRKAGEYPMVLASTVIDPERRTCRVVLGGIDRSPLRLSGTEEILAQPNLGKIVDEGNLLAAVRADVARANRGETPYQAKLAETAVLRSVSMALQ